VDFAAHAAAMGAVARKVGGIKELEEGLAKSRSETKTTVLVIDTTPAGGENAGGAWWDVAMPEVSANPNVAKAFEDYRDEIAKLRDKK
jgi:3D-(3,5/4)-trihydroxycyclohexane-1,2-dione acylhydrolase (decyclizing)